MVQTQTSPAKSSTLLPKARNRMSKDISHENALGLRSHNAQTVPLLPPDHPHAKPHGTENTAPRLDDDQRRSRQHDGDEPKKIHKRSKSAVSLRSLVGGGDAKKTKEKEKKPRSQSPEKQNQSPKKTVKKTKSSTGLSSLFSRRNKSSKDLSQQTGNQETSAPPATTESVDPPIWAQFSSGQGPEPPTHKRQPRVRTDISDEKLIGLKNEIDRYTPREYDPSHQRDFVGIKPALSRPTSSHRPQSAVVNGSMVEEWQRALLCAQRSQLGSRGSETSSLAFKDSRTAPNSRPQSMHSDLHRHASGSSADQPPLQDIAIAKRGTRVAAAVAAIHNKIGSPRKADPKTDPKLDPKQVDDAFEAVLERRNIPEDQRRSMRSLTLHVKADFVRQDEKTSRPSSPVKGESMIKTLDHHTKLTDEPAESKSPSKRDRPQSKTFQFNRPDSSPSKKSRPASRPKSMQDASQLVRTNTNTSGSERERSTSLGRSAAHAATPEDYVEYLRAMHDPTKAEVGRVHKLRILLRNETVAWVGAFVAVGGMAEIIALLQRIMAIEWREDHEDQLLHEALLCLKGISTTKVALQKLAEVADDLFPKLLGMIFDEQKKGPSEFNTRGVVIATLFTYLSAAVTSSPCTLSSRATQILSYLEDARDPTSAPLAFVAEMHSRRPYRTWSREVTNVTKEVFWIFLHHTNVVPLPSDPASDAATFPQGPSSSPTPTDRTYAARHFPGTRAPVPAAPYVGGVEWDATSYLAAHVDLLNGLLASLPSAAARNSLREDLRASGWEKVMGATLRTCKEKFYGAVHEALRCWVAAAGDDGWDVAFVRTGLGGQTAAAKAGAKERGRVELPSLGLGEVRFERKTDLDGWLV